MRLLNINEGRGVVTGVDSWSNLCKYIVSIKDLKSKRYKVPCEYCEVTDSSILPNWIKKVTICIPKNQKDDYIVGGAATIGIEEMEVEDNVVKNTVIWISRRRWENREVNIIILTLEHEMQHAYEFYKIYKKIGYPKNYKYPIDPIYYDGDDNFYLIELGDLSANNIVDLFKQCTYFCHDLELSAYSREFYLFLNKWAKTHRTISYNDLINPKNIEKTGVGPLMILKSFRILLRKLNTVKDLDLIAESLRKRNYDKVVVKKIIKISDPTQYIEYLIKEILSSIGAQVEKRYNRIIEDVMMNNPRFKSDLVNGLLK